MARPFASSLTIYTDSLGAEILRNFNLNANIHSSLDEIPKNIPGEMFAYPKMFMLSKLENPVVHIDHDVFIKEDFTVYNQDSDIVAEVEENTESTSFHGHSLNCYTDSYAYLNKTLGSKNLAFLKEKQPSIYLFPQTVRAYNCGFLNINNPKVAKSWASQSVQAYHLFLGKDFHPINNIVIEQALLYTLSVVENFKVTALFHKDFLPKNNYLHVMGKKTSEHISALLFILYKIKLINRVLFDTVCKVYGFSVLPADPAPEKYKDLLMEHSDFLVYFLNQNFFLNKSKELDFFPNVVELKSELLQYLPKVPGKDQIDYAKIDSGTKKIIYDLTVKKKVIDIIYPCLFVAFLQIKSPYLKNIFFAEKIKLSAINEDIVFKPKRETPLERLKRTKEEDKKMTGLKMASNFVVAMTEAAKTGFKKVTPDQHAQRMAICNSCQFWDAKARLGAGKCNKCGCTGAKQWLSASRCPIGLWAALP